VQVLSFVAKGTIEEGLLSVLGFKRSLFTGVLDGGASEVFLGGSRLKRFLDSVEQVTTAIPASIVEEPAPPEGQEVAASDGDAPAAIAAPPGAVGPWTGLLQAGLELLGRMAATADGSGHPGPVPLPFKRERDERTGQLYLKIRMPEPAVVDRAADALQALLASFRS
jgi:hypothetical protein